jgi:hypothetical protein
VPVVRAVRAEVFVPTTRNVQKWTSLDVLKGNNWDLEGRDKALLFMVLDGMIPCGASVLLGLNVLALQDDMERPIGPMWDVLVLSCDLSDWNRRASCLVTNRISHGGSLDCDRHAVVGCVGGTKWTTGGGLDGKHCRSTHLTGGAASACPAWHSGRAGSLEAVRTA